MVSQAVTCGVDPRAAWDYTPGELLEYIRGFREREQRKGYFGYNLAVCIANMIFGKREIKPWQAFPGLIEQPEVSEEAMWQALTKWAGGYDGSGQAEYENPAAGI